jgi:multiple sugar transport system substrate-binding protein
MKPSRIMQVAAVVVAAGMSLAGCGGTSSADGGSGETQNITFWGPWAGDQVAQIKTMTDKYNASQKKYKVTYTAQSSAMEQKLLTSIASGGAPDVVLWDSFQTGTYAPKGALTAIDDLVKKDNVNTDDYYPSALEQLKSNGKLYGLPLVSDVRVLAYNKTMFEKAGITSAPTNWDELYTDAKKLTVTKDGKLETSGLLLGTGDFAQYLWQAGGKLSDDEGKKVAFNDAAGKEVLNYWKKLLDAGIYEPGFDTKTDQFAAGKAAMKWDAPWDFQTLDDSGIKYAFAEPPAGPNGDKASMTGGFSLVMPKGSKHADGAWDFVKWFAANEDNELAFCKVSQWLPANKNVAKDEFFQTEKWSPFIKALEYSHPRPQTTGWQDAWAKSMDANLQKFMTGDMSVDQVLSQSETQMNELLAKSFAEAKE